MKSAHEILLESDENATLRARLVDVTWQRNMLMIKCDHRNIMDQCRVEDFSICSPENCSRLKEQP